MKRIKMVMTWIVFIAGLSKAVQAEELRLDLLHQSDYDVKIERTELVQYNHSYLSDAQLNLFWYNRTQRIVNGSCNILTDLTDNLTGLFQSYKFMSNEYRFFPITISVKLCKEYQRNSFEAKTILDHYSNVRSCPPKKGFYYFRNLILDFSRWPPFVPRGAYKSVLKISDNSDFVAEIHLYASILDKPLKWSN